MSDPERRRQSRKLPAKILAVLALIGALIAIPNDLVDLPGSIGKLFGGEPATSEPPVPPPATSSPAPTQTAPPIAAPPTVGPVPTAPPTPDYVVAAGPVEINAPLQHACQPTVLDLDVPSSVPMGHTPDGTDLDYQNCSPEGLVKYEAQFFGQGPASQPDPSTCAQRAKTRAVGNIEAKDMVVGQAAFCIVTDQSSVAWLQLIGKSGPEQVDLTFRVIVWKPRL